MQETEHGQDSILGWFVKLGGELQPFTWRNITVNTEFVYTLSDSQDTYIPGDDMDESFTGIYNHIITQNSSAGRYIDNEGYGKYGHDIVSEVMWHASGNRTLVIDGNMSVAALLKQLYVSANSVILIDATVIKDVEESIDSKSIYKTWTINGKVPNGCSGSVLIDTVSSSLLLGNGTVIIERGIYLNSWKQYIGTNNNQLTPSSVAV